MKKYLCIISLACAILTNSCMDRDTLDKTSQYGSGSVRFSMDLSSVGSAADSPETVVNYPSDFQVDCINIYLFDAEGQVVKTFENVENHLSEETSTTDITLEHVPAGNNQTLLCVVNPDSFEELKNLPLDITLEQILRFVSRPVDSSHPDASMFMVSKSQINVKDGATTHITATLTRGVARLDVFSVDRSIKVDSVRILGTAAKSYMVSQTGVDIEKISLTKSLDKFEGRSKITYLNELSKPVNLEIYLTRNGVQGVTNLQVPAVVRNNIYSVNLEVPNGTHLITGTLSITPWQNNILDGSVASDVSFDREATLSSFSMRDGGSVSMINDTTLLLPGGKGAGLLCFRDGAEVAVSLVNPLDTIMLDINRNAVTRGSIQTSFDVTVKSLQTTLQDSLRETRLQVSNLMTGKQRIFILRQQSSGYKEINIPALNFSNSHQYTVNLSLEGVANASELTIPADNAFSVTLLKQPSGLYGITVSRKRIYDVVSLNKQLILTRSGKKAVVIRLTPDKGFLYKEVQMGGVTFMDRDLGAIDADHTGEIFIPGSLIPLDQAKFAPGVANGFVGQGRARASDVSHNYDTKWFTKSNGEKNEEIDPCPAGWHVATLSEYQEILTSVSGQTNNIIPNQGRLNTTLEINTSTKVITATLADKTLNFNNTGGHFFDNALAIYADWPSGWWTSSKDPVSKLFNHLSFCIKSPYEIGLRIHNLANNKNGFNIRCVKDESSISETIPTVRLGGKEWMSFNSMGQGNSVQLRCNPWEDVEALYRKEWPERLGMLFQWGRKYAHNQWTVYSNNPGKESAGFSDWNTTPDQVPCPDGFRIPTLEEFTTLLPSTTLPTQATYLYGKERVKISLENAIPETVSNWHGYSGQARYLKITSVGTGNYIIFPLSGDKPDKSTASNPRLGQTFRFWLSGLTVNDGGRITDLKYEPLLRTVAIPTLDRMRPKEAYDYVRCIKK